MKRIAIFIFVLFFSLNLCLAKEQTDKIYLQNERAQTEEAQGNMLLNKQYYSTDSVNSPYAEWRKPGDLREAIMHYKNALAIEYKASPLVGLGMAYYNLKEYSDAIESFTNVITLVPEGSSKVYLYRALCYTKLGMKEKANKDLKKAAAITPEEKFNGYPILYQDINIEKTYEQIAYPEKFNYGCLGFYRI